MTRALKNLSRREIRRRIRAAVAAVGDSGARVRARLAARS